MKASRTKWRTSDQWYIAFAVVLVTLSAVWTALYFLRGDQHTATKEVSLSQEGRSRATANVPDQLKMNATLLASYPGVSFWGKDVITTDGKGLFAISTGDKVSMFKSRGESWSFIVSSHFAELSTCSIRNIGINSEDRITCIDNGGRMIVVEKYGVVFVKEGPFRVVSAWPGGAVVHSQSDQLLSYNSEGQVVFSANVNSSVALSRVQEGGVFFTGDSSGKVSRWSAINHIVWTMNPLSALDQSELGEHPMLSTLRTSSDSTVELLWIGGVIGGHPSGFMARVASDGQVNFRKQFLMQSVPVAFTVDEASNTYTLNSSSQLICLDDSGGDRWSLQLSGEVSTGPTWLTCGSLLIGSWDGRILCVDQHGVLMDETRLAEAPEMRGNATDPTPTAIAKIIPIEPDTAVCAIGSEKVFLIEVRSVNRELVP